MEFAEFVDAVQRTKGYSKYTPDIKVVLSVRDPVTGEPAYCEDFGMMLDFGGKQNRVVIHPRQPFVADPPLPLPSEVIRQRQEAAQEA